MSLKKFFLLFISFIFFACNTPKAVYDYDVDKDFSAYSEYALFPDFESGLNQLDESRILASLDAALEEKGFTTSDAPQMYVNVYAEEFVRDERNSGVGIGVGGGGGNVGVGVSGGIPLGGPENYLEITFDFVDVEEDALIWQAKVESKFNPDSSPEERKAQFDKIVQKALEGYPPEK